MNYEVKTELTKEDFRDFLELHKKIASRPLYLIGRIVASQADERILTDGKVDLGKMRPVIFDPSFLVYRVVGKTVGSAFRDGLTLK